MGHKTDIHAAWLRTRRRGESGHHGDGKLKPLRAVHSEDPHRVVVRLGQYRLDYSGAFTRLSFDPLKVFAQCVTAGFLPCAALVEDEAQSPPQISRPTFLCGEFEKPPFAEYALEHLVRR